MFGPLWNIQGQRREFGENLTIWVGLAVHIQRQGQSEKHSGSIWGVRKVPMRAEVSAEGAKRDRKLQNRSQNWSQEGQKCSQKGQGEAKRANIEAKNANMEAKRGKYCNFEPKC